MPVASVEYNSRVKDEDDAAYEAGALKDWHCRALLLPVPTRDDCTTVKILVCDVSPCCSSGEL